MAPRPVAVSQPKKAEPQAMPAELLALALADGGHRAAVDAAALVQTALAVVVVEPRRQVDPVAVGVPS